jgi:hypothetical protein
MIFLEKLLFLEKIICPEKIITCPKNFLSRPPPPPPQLFDASYATELGQRKDSSSLKFVWV